MLGGGGGGRVKFQWCIMYEKYTNSPISVCVCGGGEVARVGHTNYPSQDEIIVGPRPHAIP